MQTKLETGQARDLYNSTFKSKNRNVVELDRIVLNRQAKRKIARFARYYQVDAYRAFQACFTDPERPNCFLISPTASGKSLIMILMALGWIAAGRKVIIVVPQNSIKGGFGSQDFMLEDEPIHWDAPVNLPEEDGELMDGAGEVRGLLDFLDAPNIQGEQSWICTYQTFIAALSDPVARELFDATAVIMDEAHHLSSDGEDYSIRSRNRGGAALALLLRRGIPHMLCTATPYRADGNNILPQTDQHRYVQFTRQRADHIADFEHVDGYKTCVSVGVVMEILEARLKDAKAARHKVLIALPHVASDHARRFARQLGLKHTDNNKLQFERAILELCEKLGMSCVSVVREETFQHNDRRLRSAFIKLGREGSSEEDLERIPDVTLVQERYKEGTDCVAWTLCIQIGLSNSCVFLSQFPGRVLRDHWSKKGHTVEFLSLLPDYQDKDQEEKKDFAMDTIKSILTLSFMDVDLRRRQLFQLREDLCNDNSNDHSEPDAEDQETKRASAATSIGLAPEPPEVTAVLDSANPQQVATALDRFVHGAATSADLTILEASIPNLPDMPIQRIPVNSMLSDHEIRFRNVTERLIAFARIISKNDAKAFRDRLAHSSTLHMELAIEQMYQEHSCSPQEIAASLRSETQYVRQHLLSKRLLRPQQAIRVKSGPKRKKIKGTRETTDV